MASSATAWGDDLGIGSPEALAAVFPDNLEIKIDTGTAQVRSVTIEGGEVTICICAKLRAVAANDKPSDVKISSPEPEAASRIPPIPPAEALVQRRPLKLEDL